MQRRTRRSFVGFLLGWGWLALGGSAASHGDVGHAIRWPSAAGSAVPGASSAASSAPTLADSTAADSTASITTDSSTASSPAAADTSGARSGASTTDRAAISRLISELEGMPDLSDSSRVRIEIGASSDVTNEQFYETDYTDPTFLKRTLISTPETQTAGVLFTSIAGTRARRAVSYQLQNQVSVGNKVRQGSIALNWRHDLDEAWRYVFLPRLEYRRDRTFDRDLEEWRGAGGARLRRQLADRAWAAELGVNGELLRSSGYGSDLLLDRQVGEVSMNLDHVPLVGAEGRLGYRLAMRAFPDSISRDHWEHGWEGRWKKSIGAGHSLLFETNGARRFTRRIASTSRDNFWEADGVLEGEARWSESGSVRARVGLETMTYDVEDDLLFFDYRVARARLGPRVERGALAVTLESRGEALFAPRSVAEQYREIGGAAELEYLAAGAWWSVTPGAGWRDYSESPAEDSLGTSGLHSSFAFYELGVLADQTLPLALRVRLYANARVEKHLDAAQDARSLYFSLDVRRLF